MQLNRKYHTQISPTMMIPSLKYLMKCTNFPMTPCEIIFSRWEQLPTINKLSSGLKLYYFNDDITDDMEYYLMVIINKYGAQAGQTNYIFYKDYN